MRDGLLLESYQLKVSLTRISPMIWRRVPVRSDLSLYDLQRVIQVTFGWEDDPIHEFKIHGRHFTAQGTGDRRWDARGQEIRLADLGLRVRQTLFYAYDFGDYWEHEVRVEARSACGPQTRYPTCLAGKRAGPTEDSGGPDAYPQLID